MKILDSTKLLKYASQTRYDFAGRFDGHEEIEKLFEALTLKSGNRIFRLKDVDYYEIRTQYTDKKDKPNHISVYFKVQKDAYAKELWKNWTQHFTIHISFRKLSILKKEYWAGYKRPLEVIKNHSTILSKDFKFDSIINMSTKDIYKRGNSKVW